MSFRIASPNAVVDDSSPNPVVEMAIDDAIASGLVVVAAAGNSGESGMVWPGAYPQVISAGAIGWTRQLQPVVDGRINSDFWWAVDIGSDPDPRRGLKEVSEAYVAAFSSRAMPDRGQELDVMGPGVWVPHTLDTPTASGLWFGFGTSLASPLTAGVAALMLEKNPRLTQGQVEAILKGAALPMNRVDSRSNVFDPLTPRTISWDDDCSGTPCDPVGAGLIQADAALATTPRR